MLRSLLSVGGFTLLSRVSGYFRDAVMAAILGRGLLSDAFLVAFRLPNHFRTIFAEGAYNAAFVPLYSGIRTASKETAAEFARNMLGWQIGIQIVLLIVALIAMPWVVTLLAPGFVARPEQMALAVELTRITFGYLLLVSIVTHLGDVLNAERRFWAPAAVPVLLNLGMIVSLLLVFLFPTAAHAAAWGVLLGGVSEILLLAFVTWRSKLPVLPDFPRWTPDVKKFAVRFGPAALGAAGVQIAMFIDTILASFLATGELTSLYFADRLNQLPVGVVGVALGTVLLPELSRAVATGDQERATSSFNRATELGLLLTLPCVMVFFVYPDAIMQGLFARGAFTVNAAQAASVVLVAYAWGLPAYILLRTVTPIFHARGDTTTPVVATAIAIGANVAVKLVVVVGLNFGAEGLALGTAVGAWVNLAILAYLALQRGFVRVDERLQRGAVQIAIASTYAGFVVWLSFAALQGFAVEVGFLKAEITLGLLGFVSALSYGVALVAVGWKR